MRRILMVIAPDQFRDEEFYVPRDIFQDQGWRVDTISTELPTGGLSNGMLGAKEPITKTLSDVDVNHYDALVVVGGMGSPQYLWDHTGLQQAVQSINTQGKVVSAICLSGAVLAKAGVLDGKQATVWEMDESLAVFKEHNVTYTGEALTQDGTLITANGPEAAEVFGQAIVVAVQSLIPTTA